MKVRAITYFLDGDVTSDAVRKAGRMLADGVKRLTDAGYEVQDRRIALSHWDRGLGRLTPAQRTECLRAVSDACRDEGIESFGLGLAAQPDQIEHLGELLVANEAFYGGADAARYPEGALDLPAIQATARTIKALAAATPTGLASFQFSCAFRARPHTPFFPVAYHDGQEGLAVAFENSDLVVNAFAGADSLATARERLECDMTAALSPVADIVARFAADVNQKFYGLDTSIAPSLEAHESLAIAFESLGIRFGASGTLAVCATITRVLQSLPVPRCGYCGLMLAVMEDVGLADVATAGGYGMDTLKVNSSVCGVGVDTVPVPGDVTLEQLEWLLQDVGALAIRLSKPLSVRVMPTPGKRAGEMTEFVSRHLCNTRVFSM